MPPANRLQNAVGAFEGGDLRTRQNFHVWQSANPVDQIVRHGRCQVGTAGQQPDLGRLTCQIDGCLARRVAGANQNHFLPGAKFSLERRGPVMDARRLKRIQVGDVETAVSCAAGDHNGTGVGALVIGQFQNEMFRMRRWVGFKTNHFVRDRHFDPEFLRLIVRPRHQRIAADAGRKAQIILNPCRRPCLASSGAAVEHQY